MPVMKRISRVVLRDIAGLRAQGFTPGQIAREIGANIDTIAEAIDRLELEASPEEKKAADWLAEPPSSVKSKSANNKTVAPPPMPDARDQAARLGECHATRTALSRVEFFDFFELNIDDMRDGYSASTLYHLYLHARIRTQMRC
jgi:hypothetical protein